MPRVSYTEAQKREAAALADVVGSEEAASQLGMDYRTVQRYQRAYGKPPGAKPDVDGWQRLMDLALAKTTAAVASGKLHPKVVATIAGIAARNVRAARQPEVEDPEDTSDSPLWDAARERFRVWINALPVEQGRAVTARLHHDIDRASEEPADQSQYAHETPEEHDARIAAALEDTMAWSEEHMDELVAWNQERERLYVARTEQMHKAGRFLEDDVADLLIEAERLLEELTNAA